MQVVCPDCNGKGEVIKEEDKCGECKGKKVIKDKKILHVYIEKGKKNKERNSEQKEIQKERKYRFLFSNCYFIILFIYFYVSCRNETWRKNLFQRRFR